MRNRNTREFSITSKLRWQDAIKIDKQANKVGWFMVNNPLLLWKSVHTRGSGHSLTRDVYEVLKDKIKDNYPDEFEKNEKKKRLVASKRKFRSMNHKESFQWLRKRDVRFTAK